MKNIRRILQTVGSKEFFLETFDGARERLGVLDAIAEASRTGDQRSVNYATDTHVPIVASGSNSDGNWVRLADGTQIVSKRHLRIERVTSGTNFEETWTFPVAFSSIENLFSTMETSNNSSNYSDTAIRGAIIRQFSNTSPTTTQCNFGFSLSSSQSGWADVVVMAIGRWK